MTYYELGLFALDVSQKGKEGWEWELEQRGGGGVGRGC